MSKTITAEELAKHTTSDSLWMAINGKVYDLTNFLDDHPGGDEVLKDTAGRDATTEFDDVGHSEDATKMMAQYLIGTLEEGAKDKAIKTEKPKTAVTSAAKPHEPLQAGRWQRLLIPLVIILFALLIRYIIISRGSSSQ